MDGFPGVRYAILSVRCFVCLKQPNLVISPTFVSQCGFALSLSVTTVWVAQISVGLTAILENLTLHLQKFEKEDDVIYLRPLVHPGDEVTAIQDGKHDIHLFSPSEYMQIAVFRSCLEQDVLQSQNVVAFWKSY